MSEPEEGAEDFLRRWSRRKQAETRGRGGGEPPDAAKPEADLPPRGTTATTSDTPIFDPATLPPIETITATSDIGAFLGPGVPDELARAALRRAWASDPAIRDFIGLAENQWDFTQPDSVPGFGSLELTPELRQLAARLVGDTAKVPSQSALASQQTSETPGESLPRTTSETVTGNDAAKTADDLQPIPVAQTNNDAATPTEGQSPDAGWPSARRKHGSAVPR